MRTSLALSVLGVTIDQLFRLTHSATPDPVFGFYVVGKPLSALFIASSLVTTVFAAWHFFRMQDAMARGKAIAAPWELKGVGVVVASVSLLLDVGEGGRKGPGLC